MAGRYWIISANVNGAGTAEDWVPVILRDQAAFMGWRGKQTDSVRGRRLAALFEEVEKGDAILIAHGGLKTPGNRSLVACGRADGRGGGGPCPDGRAHANRIRLRPFHQLDDDPAHEGINFEGTPYFGNNQPVAIFELRPDDEGHPGNRALCRWLDQRIGPLSGSQPPISAKSGSQGQRTRTASLSHDCVEEYSMQTASRDIKAQRAEQRLVREYVDWLCEKGARPPEIKRYECRTGWPTCDLYDSHRNVLIEAKASADRGAIRMAIGQLFDYRYLHDRDERNQRAPTLAILIPKRPDDDLRGLAKSLEIAVIWREGSGFHQE